MMEIEKEGIYSEGVGIKKNTLGLQSDFCFSRREMSSNGRLE